MMACANEFDTSLLDLNKRVLAEQSPTDDAFNRNVMQGRRKKITLPDDVQYQINIHEEVLIDMT